MDVYDAKLNGDTGSAKESEHERASREAERAVEQMLERISCAPLFESYMDLVNLT